MYRSLAPVPDGDRKHPDETLREPLDTPLLVAMDDHFRVATAAKAVTELHELRSKAVEVVDLSVEDEPDARVFIGHGLIGCRREIDDCESTEAERQAGLEMRTTGVRSPRSEEH